MEFLDRIFGGRKRVTRVSPEDLGMMLVPVACDSAYSGAQAVVPSALKYDEALEDSFVLRIEALAFCLLPLLRIVEDVFPAHASVVRSSALDTAAQLLRGMLENPSETGLHPEGIAGHLGERIAGYNRSLGPELSESEVMRLAGEASRVLTSRSEGNPFLMSVLANEFTGTIKHMGPAIRSYRLAD